MTLDEVAAAADVHRTHLCLNISPFRLRSLGEPDRSFPTPAASPNSTAPNSRSIRTTRGPGKIAGPP